MAQTKQNDWLVATSLNPDLDYLNFKEAGLNPANTQLLSREDYKKTEFVQNNFKDDKGKFDDNAFNAFYNKAAKTYNEFAQGDYEHKFMQQLTYQADSAFRPLDAKIAPIQFGLKKVANPMRDITGISGLFSVDKSNLSVAEIAQQNDVVDSETGKSLGFTPNDIAGNLFKLATMPNIVMATWDEDGSHLDMDGRNVKHKKGDLKTNKEGDYFYETLGNRETTGKRFLQSFDLLTTDGSLANQFDIFDADGKDKSIPKILLRAAVKIAPLALGNKVRTAYSAATAAFALAEVIPQIYKAVDGIIFDTDNVKEHGAVWRLMNNLEAGTKRYSVGTSEYAQQHTFGLENIANMLSDVVPQLYQQQWIASIPSRLGMNGKAFSELETLAKQIGADEIAIQKAVLAGDKEGFSLLTNKLGNTNKLYRELALQAEERSGEIGKVTSLAYMAATSIGDAYNSAREAGHDERMAGLITLGTMAGLYGIMNVGEIGTYALKKVGFDDVRASIKDVLKEHADEVAKTFNIQKTTELSNAAKNSIIKKTRDKVENIFKNAILHPEGFVGKALAEGIEEVSEELVQDSVNGIGSALAALGISDSKGRYDYVGSNPLDRYFMSFMGGAAGGAIFHGIEKWGSAHEALDKDTKETLATLVWKHGPEKINKMIDEMLDKDQIPANKYLSATNYEDVTEGNNTTTNYAMAKDLKDSQAYAVANYLKNLINGYDGVIRQEAKVTPDNIVAVATMQEKRAMKLSEMGADKTIKADFMNIMHGIIDQHAKLNQLMDKQQEPSEVRTKLNDLYKQRDAILNGEKFGDYVKQMMFELDTNTSGYFYKANKYIFAEQTTGKQYHNLSEDAKKEVDQKYDEYVKMQKGEKQKSAYDMFEFFAKKTGNEFAKYSEFRPLREEYRKRIYEELSGTKRLNPEDLSIFTNSQEAGLGQVVKTVTEEEVKNYNAGKLPEEQTSSAGLELLLQRMNAGIKVQGVYNMLLELNKQNVPIDSDLLNIIKRTLSNDAGKFEMNQNDLLDRIQHYVAPSEYFLDPDSGEEIETTSASESYLNNSILNSNTPLYALLEKAFQNVDIFDLDNHISKLEELIKKFIEDNKDSMDAELINPERVKEVIAFIKDIPTIVKESFDNRLAISLNGRIIGTSEALSEVNKLVERSQRNPLYDMMDSIMKSFGMKYNDITEILETEDRQLKNMHNLADYVIEDPMITHKIEQTLDVIQIMRSLLNAARTEEPGKIASGFNSVLNHYAKQYNQNLTELVEVSHEDSASINRDLGILENKLEFLLKLSEINGSDRLKEHKNTAVVLKALQYKLFDTTGGPLAHLKDVIVEVGEEPNKKVIGLFDGLDDLKVRHNATQKVFDSINVGSVGSFTDEDFKGVERELMEVEHLLFTNLNNILKATPENERKGIQKQILDQIFAESAFNRRVLLAGNSTMFTSSTDTLTDYDIAIYLATVLSGDTYEFSTLLKGVVESDAFEYVPLFVQEYAARMSYVAVENPSIFNYLSEIIPHEYDKDARGLLNFIFINGFPGSGKTTATGRILNEIFKAKGYDVWASGPNEERVTSLSKHIDGASKSMTIDDMLNELFKDDFLGKLEEEIIKPGELVKLPEKSDVGLDAYLNLSNEEILNSLKPEVNKFPRVIVIDEATHLNKAAAELLTRVANLKGFSIIGLGDTGQFGYRVKDGNAGRSKTDFSFAKDFYIGSPTLAFSIRAMNNHKKDNNLVLRASVTKLIESNSNQFIDPTTQDNSLENYKLYLNETILNYFENDSSLYGDKLQKEISIADIKRLVEDSKDEKILFITDKMESALVKDIKNAGFEDRFLFLKDSEVQGREAKYAIVDVDMSLGNNAMLHASLLNTLLTRAKQATLVTGDGVGQLSALGIKNRAKDNVIDIQLDTTSDSYKNFKELRIQSLEGSLKEYIAPEAISKVVSTVKTPKKTIVEGEETAIIPVIQGVVSTEGELGEPSIGFIDDGKMLASTQHMRVGAEVVLNRDGSRTVKIASPNEDIGLFVQDGESPDKYSKELRAFEQFKATLLNADQDKWPSLIKGTDFYELEALKGYDLTNGSLKLIATKFNSKIDSSQERYNLNNDGTPYVDPRADGSTYFRVVYEFPYVANGNTGEVGRITLSSLFMPSIIRKAANANGIAESLAEKKYKEYAKIAEKGFKEGKELVEFVFKSPWKASNVVGNIRINKNPAVNVPFADSNGTINLHAAYGFMRSSNPYVLTNYDKDISWIKPEIIGRAVVFLCSDPNLKWPGTNRAVLESEFKQYYINMIQEQQENNGKNISYRNVVRMAVANTKGRSFDEFLKEYGEVFDEWASGNRGKGSKKSIFTISHFYMASTILNGVYKRVAEIDKELANNKTAKITKDKLTEERMSITSLLTFFDNFIGYEKDENGNWINRFQITPVQSATGDYEFTDTHLKKVLEKLGKEGFEQIINDVKATSKNPNIDLAQIGNVHYAQSFRMMYLMKRLIDGKESGFMSKEAATKMKNYMSKIIEKEFPNGIEYHPVIKSTGTDSDTEMFMEAMNDPRQFYFSKTKFEKPRVLVDLNDVITEEDANKRLAESTELLEKKALSFSSAIGKFGDSLVDSGLELLFEPALHSIEQEASKVLDSLSGEPDLLMLEKAHSSIDSLMSKLPNILDKTTKDLVGTKLGDNDYIYDITLVQDDKTGIPQSISHELVSDKIKKLDGIDENAPIFITSYNKTKKIAKFYIPLDESHSLEYEANLSTGELTDLNVVEESEARQELSKQQAIFDSALSTFIVQGATPEENALMQQFIALGTDGQADLSVRGTFLNAKGEHDPGMLADFIRQNAATYLLLSKKFKTDLKNIIQLRKDIIKYKTKNNLC